MEDRQFLRHALATLAYRASRAITGAPDSFSDYRPGPSSRTAGQILAHMGDLFDWVLSQARGQEKWRDSQPQSWSADSDRFFAALSAFDQYIASGADLHASVEKMFQGATADALTHVGQLAMMRHLAGCKMKGENYAVARISAGTTTASQESPVRAFD